MGLRRRVTLSGKRVVEDRAAGDAGGGDFRLGPGRVDRALGGDETVRQVARAAAGGGMRGGVVIDDVRGCGCGSRKTMTYDWFNQACGSLWNTIFSEIRALAPDARLMRIREAADIACFIHGAGDSVKSGTSTLAGC